MLSNLSMKNKLLFTVLPLMLLIYLATVLLVYHSNKSSTEALAEVAIDAIARQQAAEITHYFDASLHGLRNSAVLMSNEMIDGELPDRRIADQMLESLLEGSQQAAAVWWVPRKAASEQVAFWLRGERGLYPGLDAQREALLTALGDGLGSREQVIPLLSLEGGQRVIALLVPVISGQQVVGSLGIGLDAAQLQQRVSTLRPLDVGVAALIASNNTLVAHPDPSRVGRKQQETERDFLGNHFDAVIAAVSRGERMTLRFDSPVMAEEIFMLVTPVAIGATDAPWSLGLAFPSSALLGGVKALAIKLLILGAAAAAVLAIAVIVLGGALARPLQGFVETVRELAAGEADLTSRLPVRGTDELATLAQEFNHFLEAMADLVLQIKGASQALSETAVELQEQSRASGQAVDAQRDEVGQLVTAMQQMAGTIDEVAGNAGTAAAAMNKGDEAVAQGLATVAGLVTAIHEDARTLERVSDLTVQLNEASESIGTIVAVIGNIANQTNLLALNAAIESARAGEHGRGFAVVADEVRALAQRTHTSTEEVCASISLIQERTRTVVDIIEQSRDASLSNVGRAQKASEALASLSDIMGRVRDMSEQIATATEQQATTSDLLTRSLVNIADSAERASESANQISVRSDGLEADATRLGALVSRFRL